MKSFFNPTAFQIGGKRRDVLPQCGRCGLSKDCQTPKMPPVGKGKRRILFVADSPGMDEDDTGEHMVGKPGIYLRKLLKTLRCNVDDCVKTNAVICYPGEETKDVQIEACRPNLLNAIKEHKPNVIVLLGKAAVRSLIPTEREGAVGSIAKWVGFQIPSHEHQAWICPVYHPAYVLRMKDPVLELLLKQQLKSALKLEKVPITVPTVDELKAKVEVILDPRKARLRLKELAKKSGRLAFDYEGTGLKPEHPKQRIVSCSFCLEGEDTFAVMMNPKNMKLVSKILRDPKFPKVASNLKYEERWTVAKMGHKVANWYWDTMQAAHILDNRSGITSVKFQAYVHFGVTNYDQAVEHFFRGNAQGFNRIDEIDKEMLLLYNGMDSLLEFMVMEVQRKAMGL